MAKKMLVTEALDERDLLLKKISDKISKARFADTVKRNEAKVYDARITKEDFEKEAKASFQQIMDLIERFRKIDIHIIESNANTYIETSYGRMSVAAAVSLRGRMSGTSTYEDRAAFERNLVKAMQLQYDECVEFAESCNQKLQSTAEEMRLSILGKCTQVKEDKPLEIVDAYVRENTTELADPLGIQKKVEEILQKRDDFLRELDTQIKISNATTFIER